MVYIVHSLNYCSVEYYYMYALAMHALRMSYRFVTILVHKIYIVLQLRYDTLPFLIGL